MLASGQNPFFPFFLLNKKLKEYGSLTPTYLKKKIGKFMLLEVKT